MLLSPPLRSFSSSAALTLALAWCGCANPEPLSFPAHFSVLADGKTPLTGAQIAARGQPIGATDASGELQVRLRGFEGDRVPISLTCPDGYAGNPGESVIILRSVQGLGGEERKPIDHPLGCQPTKRDAVIVVHAGGAAASLPVKIDGAVAGQTDSLGFAHLHLRPDPGTRIQVSLDTSSNDKLMPQNPQQTFQIDTRDEVFVFDREFKLPPPPKPKPKKRVKKAAPEVHIPIRLN